MNHFTRKETHLNPVNFDLLEMVEEFAVRECGGKPDDILIKAGGIYTIVYGHLYNYDREEIDCKIINGVVVAI